MTTTLNRISANIEALGSAHIMEHAEVELSPEKGIRINFAKAKAVIESHIVNFELPEQWADYSTLQLQLKNAGSNKVEIEISVVCPASRLGETIEIEAGKSEILNFNIHEIPLCEGHDIPWKVDSLRFSSNEEAPVDLISIELIEEAKSTSPLIDNFGQRIHGEWKAKISSHEELKKQIENEIEIVSNSKPTHEQSKYKAWSGKQFNASGHFKLAKTGKGLWWFIDPEGYPFWSLGVGAVNLNSVDYKTKLHCREELFTCLERHELEPEIKTEESINFFHRNMLWAHGSNSKYYEYLNQFLSYTGINTIGASSTIDELHLENTPFLLSLTTNKKLITANGMPDVFHENWEEHVAEIFEKNIPQYKNHPSLLGYLVDEKINWEKPRLLDAESHTKLKSEWRNFIKDRYDSIEAFNESWILNYTSWEQLPHMAQSSIPRGKESATKDVDDFTVFYAKKYFDVIYKQLNSYDDKHLYFGCGIGPELPCQKLLELLGDYIDVVCFQSTGKAFETNKLEKVHKYSTRPLMLIGFQAPIISEQQGQSIHHNYKQEERKEYIQSTAETLLKLPYVLGFHLDRLVDYPMSGSFEHGKQGSVGLLNITGKSYPESVSSIRSISANIYKIRAL